MQKFIALTSANELAMSAAAEQLLAASSGRGLQISVSVGVKDAFAAQAVYAHGGELWRIGEDDGAPELDALIDCQIDDSTPSILSRRVDEELERFLGKVRVAA